MPTAQLLSSPANPLLKDVRKALRRGTLTAQGYCVAEGVHLLEEARRSGSSIHAILVAQSAEAEIAKSSQGADERTIVVDNRSFHALSDLETPQGVLCLVEPHDWRLEDLLDAEGPIVILDGIQHPGNAGTIVRTAEAFGAAGVVFLKGSVNPFNPKTIRAAAGSLFRLPFVHNLKSADALSNFIDRRIKLYAGVPCGTGAIVLPRIDLTGKCAIVIGNEGGGVGEPFRSAAMPVAIPTGGVESLNAAIAAAIFLYETRRQGMRQGIQPA
ncbi:MAG: RNA methyltransferase [Acidobacteriota bacterium]|nr:RNA methyltransferase [Acidobacteriota bacterium]